MVNISTFSLQVIKEKGGRYDLDTNKMNSPKISTKAFNEVFNLKNRAEEVLVMMTLDTKLKITGMFLISMGSLDSAVVHPREIYKRALLQNASSIIIAHNHPSGNPEPSKQDVNMTIRIQEAGKIMGIELLDHIIIADNKFLSFKEKELI